MTRPDAPVETGDVQPSAFSQMLAADPAWIPRTAPSRFTGHLPGIAVAVVGVVMAVAVAAMLVSSPASGHRHGLTAVKFNSPTSSTAVGTPGPVPTVTVRVTVPKVPVPVSARVTVHRPAPRPVVRSSAPTPSATPEAKTTAKPGSASSRTTKASAGASPASSRKPTARRAVKSTPTHQSAALPYTLAASSSFGASAAGVITGSVDVSTNLSPVRVVFHVSGPRSLSAVMHRAGGRFSGGVRTTKSGTYRTWATVTAGAHTITTPTGSLAVSA